MGNLPPLFHQNFFNLRIISALLGSLMPVLTFLFVIKHSFDRKTALFAAFFMSILPWGIVESRIASQVNIALFFVLLIFFLYSISNGVWKYISLFLIPAAVVLTYPDIWFIKKMEIISPQSFFNNLMILTSFEMLTNKNITFWWGGVREFGIIYLSLTPLFISGLFHLFRKKYSAILLVFLLILLVTAMSPFFPESREFYLSLHIFTLICALGLRKLSLSKNLYIKMFVIFMSFFIIYEFSQFLHFYVRHYPGQVRENQSKIYGTF